jgi:hypothetical protein
MDALSHPKTAQLLLRALAPMKLVSRLLAHELHAQAGKQITLSREEVHEIQASIDLFIEEVTRRQGPMGGHGPGSNAHETTLVSARG